MDITGKIIVALPEVGGTSNASGKAWRKREYVLETHDQYPRRVFFNLFGDRIDQYPMNVGDEVKVYFDIDSREYNGRWYVDIRAWKVEPANAAPAAGGMPPYGQPAPQQMPGGYNVSTPFPPTTPGDDSENMPF